MFSDDVLTEQIVLKGGNAISLVYGYTSRTSLDLDFSIDQDFSDLEDTRTRLFRALETRFAAEGLVVFDRTFEAKPSVVDRHHPNWGGYELKFKLIERDRWELIRDLDSARRQALEVGPRHLRTFTVQLSKFEYCGGKAERELDHYTIYVYTPAMIVAEKIRAICQQMPEYELCSRQTPRARDFFDIYQVITRGGVSLSEKSNMELLSHMFASKQVPLELIARIPSQREFHRPDWASVRASVRGNIEEFDFYFNFVIREMNSLKALWEE